MRTSQGGGKRYTEKRTRQLEKTKENSGYAYVFSSVGCVEAGVMRRRVRERRRLKQSIDAKENKRQDASHSSRTCTCAYQHQYQLHVVAPSPPKPFSYPSFTTYPPANTTTTLYDCIISHPFILHHGRHPHPNPGRIGHGNIAPILPQLTTPPR